MIDPEILDALRSIKTLDVKTTIECGYNPWTKDETLVAGTLEKGRLLLTANYNDITPTRYPPCGHGGILLIKHPKPNGHVVHQRMQSFSVSGGRSQAKGHVTFISENKAVVHKLHKEVIELHF